MDFTGALPPVTGNTGHSATASAPLFSLRKTIELSHLLFAECPRAPPPPEGYLPTVLTHAPPGVRPELGSLSDEAAVNILRKLRAPYEFLESATSRQEYYHLLSSTVNNTSLPLERLTAFADEVASQLDSTPAGLRESRWSDLRKDFYAFEFAPHSLYRGICRNAIR